MCIIAIIQAVRHRLNCMFNDCDGDYPVFFDELDDEYNYTNRVSSVEEQDRYMQGRYYNEDLIE